MTGAQGGSNSPALAAGHRGEVAVSGSGEESMDLDSGVDGELLASLGGWGPAGRVACGLMLSPA